MTPALRRSNSQNRIDKLANRLQAEGRIEDLERELQQFNPQQLKGAEREAWYHLWGIVALQRGDHAEALGRFSEGFSACPESGMIAFSLAQEFEHLGQVPRMLELFDAFHFPQVPANYALAQARYAYLWDQPQKALQYTMPILDAYYKLGIADDHFLYVRGLPFFSKTWGYLGAFLELTHDLATLRAVTAEAQKRLSDYDFDHHLLFLSCVEKSDFTDLVVQLERMASDYAQRGWPSGYSALKAAILRVQEADDTQKAERVLREVELSDKDFRWLEDIRLLARCAVANRADDHQREAELVQQFLLKQPLLFEPDHVFSFRLLWYQEKVRPKYQERKKNRSEV